MRLALIPRPRRRERVPGISRSTLPLPEFFRETIAGITQRPGRSAMTMLGTVLGVGAFVAILGLTTTASAQIGQQFSVLQATTVTVTDAGAAQAAAEGQATAPSDFPADSDARVDRLNGVVAAGEWWQVSFPDAPVIASVPDTVKGSSADAGASAQVFAASPGTFQAMGAHLQSGVLFNEFHNQRGEPVTVLGAAFARQLGITSPYEQPAVFVNGQAFTVVGIISAADENPDMLLGMIVPAGTALKYFGGPSANAPAQMLVRTRLGAAQLVARQAPLALDPARPSALSAAPPPNPRQLSDAVSGDVTGLFLALAIICLVIGAVSIANTTFVAVLERTGEIGLRRSLGALRRHIAAQFLAESAALGLLGGLLGTALAVVCVLAFALARQWTAVLNPLTVLPAPLIGGVTGLLAGVYPAMRASLIEPVEALRR